MALLPHVVQGVIFARHGTEHHNATDVYFEMLYLVGNENTGVSVFFITLLDYDYSTYSHFATVFLDGAGYKLYCWCGDVPWILRRASLQPMCSASARAESV